MKVLLSIKPEFAELIFSGVKKFEYRKILFKNPSISIVIVYASSPVKKVIGEFEIGGIIQNEKEKVWEATKEFSGISKGYFDEYFRSKENANAIGIKQVLRYKKPKDLVRDFDIAYAPQSFVYVK